jgi:hypothetical protein
LRRASTHTIGIAGDDQTRQREYIAQAPWHPGDCRQRGRRGGRRRCGSHGAASADNAPPRRSSVDCNRQNNGAMGAAKPFSLASYRGLRASTTRTVAGMSIGPSDS